MAVSSAHGIVIFDADTWQIIASTALDEPVNDTALWPDGSILACAPAGTTNKSDNGTLVPVGPSVILLGASDGRERRALVRHFDPVLSLAFSPDGRQLASGSYDQMVRV